MAVMRPLGVRHAVDLERFHGEVNVEYMAWRSLTPAHSESDIRVPTGGRFEVFHARKRLKPVAAPAASEHDTFAIQVRRRLAAPPRHVGPPTQPTGLSTPCGRSATSRTRRRTCASERVRCSGISGGERALGLCRATKGFRRAFRDSAPARLAGEPREPCVAGRSGWGVRRRSGPGVRTTGTATTRRRPTPRRSRNSKQPL